MTSYSAALINRGKPFTLPAMGGMGTEQRQTFQANAVQIMFTIAPLCHLNTGASINLKMRLDDKKK